MRKDHPLRASRAMVNEMLRALSPQVDSMYPSEGRPSIAPQKLLRGRLLQTTYSMRSERLVMQEIHYSILFRWFVSLNLERLGGGLPLETRSLSRGYGFATASSAATA